MTENLELFSSIKKKLFELGSSSTIHGISNILKTNRLLIRIIWIVSLLCSFSLCVSLILNSVMEYLKYDTTTDTKIIYQNPTEFPAVSFCDLQGLAKNYTLNQTLILCVYNRGIYEILIFNI